MRTAQTGILADIPGHALYVSYQLADVTALPAALRSLQAEADGDRCVVGIGASLVAALNASIPGLRDGFDIPGALVPLPQQPIALWLWLRGEDRGDLLLAERAWTQRLQPAFVRHQWVDAFRHGDGRDLTGYKDGTENPVDELAVAAACVSSANIDLEGSSFAAIQQWLHQFERFDAMSPEAQDHAIGRRRSDDVELEDAPESAHVKRTAQEDFEPEAFVLRRSMPWSAGNRAGLMFVAFGHSFQAFEAQLTRMSGAEDGVLDALFQFSQPVTSHYVWCPPMLDGHLDLNLLL
ncbi:MAG: Dyp-type peroxidase [Pseudomonadota bacterium]|mgnify:FL=1